MLANSIKNIDISWPTSVANLSLAASSVIALCKVLSLGDNSTSVSDNMIDGCPFDQQSNYPSSQHETDSQDAGGDSAMAKAAYEATILAIASNKGAFDNRPSVRVASKNENFRHVINRERRQ